MILWPLIIISSLFAQERAVERYCFTSVERMETVIRKSKIIFVPSDVIEKDSACFDVQMNEHRRELVQRYIRNLAPDAQISFSSAEIKREPCQLKVERVKTLNSEKKDFNLSTNPNAQAQTTQNGGKDTFQITTLKNFELSSNQDSIKGTCRFITPDRYEITLELVKEAKPLTPPVQPGTVVILNNPQLPPPQETSSLKTELQLTRGSKIEIGDVIKDLKNNSKEININPEIKASNTEGSSQEKVYLSLQ